MGWIGKNAMTNPWQHWIQQRLGSKGSWNTILFVMLSVFAVLLLVTCYVKAAGIKYFHVDEFEHIHSAWYVLQGAMPYRDFFQHHHPLLWYCLAPILAMAGETAQVLIYTRYLMLVFTFLTMLCCGLIVCEISKSWWAVFYSVVGMSAVALFLEKGVETRPDIPQMFFCVLSVYLFFLYWRWPKPGLLALSGCSLMLSFIFLQKSIFLGPVFAGTIAWELYRKRMTWKSVGYYAAGLLIPLLLFLVWMGLAGALQDYYRTNIVLNLLKKSHQVPVFGMLSIEWLENRVFWILSAPAIAFCFLYWQGPLRLKLVGWFAIFQILLLFTVQHPFRQYFVLYVVFSGIAMGIMLDWLMKHKMFRTWGSPVLALVVLLYSAAMLWRIQFSLNDFQMGRAQYVIEQTTPTDAVYDPGNEFNLFRKDLHYFWYSTTRALRKYKKHFGKYTEYNALELIREKKPKVVYNPMVCLERDETVKRLYRQSKYERIYFLKEEAPE
jgi:hypothetical protein